MIERAASLKEQLSAEQTRLFEAQLAVGGGGQGGGQGGCHGGGLGG